MTTVERFAGSELHLHVSGSIGSALVPWWIHWLREVQPDLKVNVSVTRSATEFVSLRAIRHLVEGEVWSDAWDHENVPRGVHSGSSADSECIIVFPASLDTMMRLAQGRADSPALMMMQLTTLPLVIADSIPGTNVIVDDYLDTLRRRDNVAFAPRVVGVRAVDRQPMSSGFNLPGAPVAANEIMGQGSAHE